MTGAFCRVLGALAVCTIGAVACGANLADEIDPLLEGFHGDIAVAVKRLSDGEAYRHNADKPMGTASLIKFPLMITAYEQIADGKLNPDQMITLKKEDKVPGSGIVTEHLSEGTQLSLNDAIHLMCVYSDNTATNLVIDKVGLPETAKLMEKLGCPNTKLNSKVFRGDTTIYPERSKEFGLGSTTADEMVKLLELVASGQVVNKDACDKMLGHMRACEDHGMLVRGLPAGTVIAHKTGAVSAARCDAGLIETQAGPVAICVLTDHNQDLRWTDDNEAQVLMGKIAAAVYKHFNPAGPRSAKRTGELKVGAGGKLVEALQRTLNARLKPSPDLGVDGDFGGMTEAAVKAFQKQEGLPETGVVDKAVWKKLGTLVDEGPEPPDPSIFNVEAVNKAAADDANGPPFVTCAAWAIGDGETGKLLWGFNEHGQRDIASTTKIMTAYLVLKYAQDHPEALDEIVTYSTRADDTEGSTADLNAGEKVSVRELLYGLMLPSGNDASVALAEHFGSRLAAGGNGNSEAASVGTPTTEAARAKSYDDFIAAMNRTAKELGMNAAKFANPNGLPDKNHNATAADMLVLANAALKLPQFAEIVRTPQHGATVEGPGGYKRNVAWHNTNKLLGIEGYDGVKTGTTNAAGACLVSRSHHGDKSLVLVVLGSQSSDARYSDSRNLFRWAWNQLEKRQ